MFNKQIEHRHDEQHPERRIAYLSLATEIVADEVARTTYQLQQRIRHRAVARTPDAHHALLHTLPSEATYTGLLAAQGTIVRVEFRAAVPTTYSAVALVLILERMTLPCPITGKNISDGHS